jgi:hypothetical protein
MPESKLADYNTARPHSSLSYRAPEEFATEIGSEEGCGQDARFRTKNNIILTRECQVLFPSCQISCDGTC